MGLGISHDRDFRVETETKKSEKSRDLSTEAITQARRDLSGICCHPPSSNMGKRVEPSWPPNFDSRAFQRGMNNGLNIISSVISSDAMCMSSV